MPDWTGQRTGSPEDGESSAASTTGSNDSSNELTYLERNQIESCFRALNTQVNLLAIHNILVYYHVTSSRVV